MSDAPHFDRRAFTFAAIAGFAGWGLAATPAAFAGDTVVLTGADDGRTLALKIGDRVSLTLASNPSTGYVWAFETIGPNVFGAFQQSFSGSSGMPGAGGSHSWLFTVGSVGKTRLAFKYLRPWEGDASIARKFTVDVEVK